MIYSLFFSCYQDWTMGEKTEITPGVENTKKANAKKRTAQTTAAEEAGLRSDVCVSDHDE